MFRFRILFALHWIEYSHRVYQNLRCDNVCESQFKQYIPLTHMHIHWISHPGRLAVSSEVRMLYVIRIYGKTVTERRGCRKKPTRHIVRRYPLNDRVKQGKFAVWDRESIWVSPKKEVHMFTRSQAARQQTLHCGELSHNWPVLNLTVRCCSGRRFINAGAVRGGSSSWMLQHHTTCVSCNIKKLLAGCIKYAIPRYDIPAGKQK